MLTAAEQSALDVFRSFHVSVGQMLCFHGPLLAKHGATLGQMAAKDLVVKEQFAGGFSLTRTGYEALSAKKRHSSASSSSRSAASDSASRR